MGLDGTTPLEIEHEGEPLAGYAVGDGPKVILAHGWGGRAAQMAGLAKAIADRGHTAVAFDAPAHGELRGRRTNAFEMAAGWRSVIEETGPFVGAVTHSLGAMSLLHATRSSVPERVVMVSPVLDIEEVLATFSSRAGLTPWASRGLRSRVKSFIGEHWDEFAAGRHADLGDATVLIVHDPDDQDASFATSATLAATRPNTSIFATHALGHTRILRDAGVSSVIADFVSGQAAGSQSLEALNLTA
jgi:pimeloyl-ACP methyl ester carboxylesterase